MVGDSSVKWPTTLLQHHDGPPEQKPLLVEEGIATLSMKG